MAVSKIRTLSRPWKHVTRTVSHPAGTNYFSTQVDFPSRTGYTRKPENFQSDNANVIVVGMYIDFNTSRAQWRTINVSNSTQSVTLSCDLVYERDDEQWT